MNKLRTLYAHLLWIQQMTVIHHFRIILPAESLCMDELIYDIANNECVIFSFGIAGHLKI